MADPTERSDAMQEVVPPAWLHAEDLARVWRLVGEALERRSLLARGHIALRDLTRDERHALTDVLGLPVTTADLRVDLGRLDERVGSRLGRDLAGTVTWVTGRGLVDRAGRRRESAARREAPFETASAWLMDRARRHGPTASWVDRWLDGLRRDGILTPWPDAADLLVNALTVLEDRGALEAGRRQADGVGPSGPNLAPTSAHAESAAGSPAGSSVDAAPTVARTELAAKLLGDAHALDDDTRLTALVQRAAAARLDHGLPRGAADRRLLWESIGVVNDRVSSTCLTWGLAAGGASLSVGRCGPVHVTWWDVEDGLGLRPGQVVLVCENPRTLEAVATLGPAGLAVVCTMGRPNLVVRSVLELLVAARAALHYHGDFDWPGLDMTIACSRDFGARPWLMSAADYLAGHGTIALKGAHVEAPWDPELAPAMRARGVAVHEEARLDALLRRLPDLTG
jgi:hypothetical protein